MKKIIITLVLLLSCMLNLQAQSNTGTLGGEATGSGGTASFTAGEVFYTYKSSASGSVTEGVQQSYLVFPTGVISGDATVCAGSSTQLSITLTGQGPWFGTLSDGTGFSGSATPLLVTVTPSETTTYTIATLSSETANASATDLSGSAAVTVSQPTIWYADTDLDTFGDVAISQLACEQPSGYVANSSDCDPADETKWQFATFYVDADADGYTNGTASVCSGAGAPTGYATGSSGIDCDDTNANVNTTTTETTVATSCGMYIWETGNNSDYFETGTYSYTENCVTHILELTVNQCNITFDANGGMGTMSNQTIAYNASATLTANAFTRSGYTFEGWAASSGGSVAYADEASYLMSTTQDPVVLYAKWTQVYVGYMQIFIRQSVSMPRYAGVGTTITLDVDSSDSVENVKQKINDRTSVPIGNLVLVFAGTTLEDGRTLADYNIIPESTVHVFAVNLYPATSVAVGGTTSVLSVAVPGADYANKTVSTTSDFTGTLSLLPSGEVSIQNASPVGTYLIQIDNNYNDGSLFQSFNLTVYNNTTGIISGNSTICAGTSTQLSIALTGEGPWSGTLSDGTGFSGSDNPLLVTVTPSETTTYTIATLSSETATASASDLSGSAAVTVNQPVIWYADTDLDTFGDMATSQSACEQPPSYVANSSDCDPADETKWQFATFYVDADADGYTNGTASVCSGVGAPTGYSADSSGTDCDDNAYSLSNNCSITSIVNLKFYIQGYYVGSRMMTSVKLNQDYESPDTDVEDMTIELHDAVNFSLVDTAIGTLKTDGTLSVIFRAAVAGSYYIAVKGSNLVQTWSAMPQTIGNTALNYDFSTSASQAYGDNMTEIEPGGTKP